MRLKEIVRAPKDDIKIGAWRSGKVPKADFPLAKGPYALGSSYKWNVITFQALGAEYRVLVVFHEAKEKYEAILGVIAPSGVMSVLCSRDARRLGNTHEKLYARTMDKAPSITT